MGNSVITQQFEKGLILQTKDDALKSSIVRKLNEFYGENQEVEVLAKRRGVQFEDVFVEFCEYRLGASRQQLDRLSKEEEFILVKRFDREVKIHLLWAWPVWILTFLGPFIIFVTVLSTVPDVATNFIDVLLTIIGVLSILMCLVVTPWSIASFVESPWRKYNRFRKYIFFAKWRACFQNEEQFVGVEKFDTDFVSEKVPSKNEFKW